MSYKDLTGLFLQFLMLSSMAIGGTHSVMPGMHRYVVELHHWITSRQFADAYALAQAAPGPNVMYVTLIGWQVSGWLGALATTIALIIPSGVFTILFMRVSTRNPGTPFGRAFRRGLAPVAIGLTFSSAWVLVHSVNHDWRGYALTVLAVLVALRTRFNPLWLIGGGALAGIIGLV